MEKLKYVVGKAGILFIMAVCFLTGNLVVNAEELEMFYTTQKIEVYEKKSDSSEVLTTVEEGIPIMILEKGDDWCQVQYKDATGFVKTSLLQKENEELAVELDAQQEYNNTFMNEVFRLEDEKAKSRVWGAVIVVLIMGIFGVGIFNTIKMNKKEEQVDEELPEGEDVTVSDAIQETILEDTSNEENSDSMEITDTETDNTEETAQMEDADKSEENDEADKTQNVNQEVEASLETEELQESEEADEEK